MSPPPTERVHGRLPWTVNDLVALYATTFVGLLFVGLAWFGASGAARLSSQVRWANVGVAGVIVLGAGNLWWLLRARRAAGAFRRQLLPVVEGRNLGPAAPREVEGVLVAGPGMTRFHRAGCALAKGKAVTAATESSHRRAGRRPCGVCNP